MPVLIFLFWQLILKIPQILGKYKKTPSSFLTIPSGLGLNSTEFERMTAGRQ
jgi:hypothetical protein